MARFNTRHSSSNGTHINYSLWLIFDRHGNVRSTRGEPSLAAGERAMRMNVEMPKAIFNTPVISAKVVVGDTFNADGEIDAIVEKVADDIRASLGGEVHITVGERG